MDLDGELKRGAVSRYCFIVVVLGKGTVSVA